MKQRQAWITLKDIMGKDKIKTVEIAAITSYHKLSRLKQHP